VVGPGNCVDAVPGIDDVARPAGATVVVDARTDVVDLAGAVVTVGGRRIVVGGVVVDDDPSGKSATGTVGRRAGASVRIRR
jgi:hypothetical protein